MTAEDKKKKAAETPEPEGNTKDDKNPAPIPYERFKEVNDQVGELKGVVSKLTEKVGGYEAAIEKQEQDKKKALEDAEKDKLTAVELLQKQVGTLQEAVTQEQALRQKAEDRRRRIEIAKEYNIPFELVDRLQGENDEELAKDAESLQQYLKEEKKPPGSPPVTKGGEPVGIDLDNATPAQIREASKKGQI